MKKAISLACEAKENLPVLIAGSNAPAEDCYQVQRTISKKQLELNHCYHIDSLIENGSHFILNETQGHFDEIKISQSIVKNMKFHLYEFVFDENLCLLSGEKVTDVINFLIDKNVYLIGFNCISDKILIKLINQISLPANWGFYLNCFSTNEKQTEVCSISVAEYLVTVQEVIHFNPSFIGACCGSNPEFIKAIKGFLDGRIKH